MAFNYPAEFLEFMQLSELVDLSKSPAAFLRNLLFRGPSRLMHAETLDVRTRVGDREVAPMVSPFGEAKFIKRLERTAAVIKFPRIALRWGLNAGQVQTIRSQDVPIYADQGQILSQWDLEVAEHQERAADMIANRIELMVSQLIVGTMSYSDSEGDAWQFVSPKPGANTFDAALDWDDADSDPTLDILAAKQLATDYANGVSPDVMVLSGTAMNAFVTNPAVQRYMSIPSGQNGLQVGKLSLANTFDQDGAIFLGNFEGLQCWGYPRQVSVDGTPTDLIRPDYVELLSTSRAAQNTMYFGPLHFVDVGRLEMEVFSHSWMTPDRKNMCFEVETRPMPVFHKPGAHVSIHVLNT